MKITKRLFAIFLLNILCSMSACFAQSATHNYVVKDVMQDADGKHSVTIVEYYDGLGRKEQVVSNGIVPGSPSQALLSRMLYDGVGRESQKFLPVSVSGMDYQSDIFYKNDDQRALSVITYDALNRPVSVSTPGSDMGGRSKEYHHWANKANSVKRYVVSDEGELLQDGYYPEGDLVWERVVDEDGHTTDVYTDLFGQKVLERHSLDKGTADTYFVYNDCERLSFVLQPMYQRDASLDKYAFRYRYNNRGLVSEKTIPGCEKVTYTYDLADRLLTMQDGEMRKKGMALHHAYDGFGRLKAQTLRQGDAVLCTEQVNYYDGDYSFLDSASTGLSSEEKALLVYSGKMGTTSAQNVKFGKTFLCGSIQRASDGTPIVSAMYYDQKGRLVEKNSKLLGSHLRREQFTYTFTGKVLKHTVVDYKAGKEVFRRVTTNKYDESAGILVSADVSTSMDGANADERRIASYGYDDYGRLSSATHGSATQTVSYDVRDWPMKLSSPNFTEQLSYTSGCYNGNVHKIRYTGPCYDYTYAFSYDKLNRLTYADYHNHREGEDSWADPDFDESADYDANGNITNLSRIGFPDEKEGSTWIDVLALTYNGNQLKGVVDKENDFTYMTTKNFIQFGDGESDYSYNASGALLTDRNKGIVFIDYDTYGYVSAIYFRNGSIIRYVHAPDGSKLQTSYTSAVSHLVMPYGEPFVLAPSQIQSVTTRDYWGDDIICQDGEPRMFLFDGGYADIKGTALTWHYYVTDHLGSKRIVQDEQGKVEATYNYYPFGTIFEHWAEIYAKPISQPFKFNGKELDTMYGLYGYDFGARLYDPLLGRWFGIDPLCEKYYSWSPYVFCLNNPIKHVDRDGRIVETAWDAANLAMDVTSLAANVAAGNYASALVDGVATVVDAAATAIPGVPGGAGSVVKAFRAGKNVVHASQVAKVSYKATRYNYRQVLMKATGKKGIGYEAHHTLPQKYREKFEKLGINIDAPGNVVWREAKNHRKKSNALTKEWNDFIRDNQFPSKAQVYKFRNSMEKKYFGNLYDVPKK